MEMDPLVVVPLVVVRVSWRRRRRRDERKVRDRQNRDCLARMTCDLGLVVSLDRVSGSAVVEHRWVRARLHDYAHVCEALRRRVEHDEISRLCLGDAPEMREELVLRLCVAVAIEVEVRARWISEATHHVHELVG